MLRVIRRKLVSGQITPLYRITAPASTSAAPANYRNASLTEEEPYGQAYGAGPSRLPYKPPVRPTSQSQFTPLPPTSQSQRDCARHLRRVLTESQSIGQYSNPGMLSNYLVRSNIPHLTEMSRLELHATIHHLVRTNRSTLALGIITQVIDAGASSHPKIRRVFSERTLHSLLLAETHRTTMSGHPMKLTILLDFLRALQTIRHRRPMQLYTLLVQMSIFQRRPDKAAEIFVGLVEEWVTEGRVAEGADAQGFYEGGGPPRVLREDMAARHKSWWTGVRTWKLPGEVVSPHDRLDLWHPTKLSLGGKFKNFPSPLATSPPSMVPPPSAQLLNPILAALRLDPKIATPSDFTASMRACAILANTVLSRTLPLSSLGPLLRALEATPAHPPVYPANLEKIPTQDAWAYQAFTQIHLALQSFFFSPPISAASFAFARANETVLSGTPLTTHADKYRLQPLAFGDAVILVRYALEKMRSTRVLGRLVRYVRRTFNFGWTRPAMWNAVLGGATLLGDKRLAGAADDAIFGQTILSRKETGENQSDRIAKIPIPRRNPPLATTSELATILQVDPNVAVQADEQSLCILITYLGKSSQFDRLTQVVYKLIPFLDSRDPPTPKSKSTHSEPTADDPTGHSGRLAPNHLTPNLYSAILSSLALGGKTGLAQRVYTLSLQAEKTWIRDFYDRHGETSPIPSSLRLPLSVFTAMLRVWGNEANGRPERLVRAHGLYPLGWVPPKHLAGQPRHVAAGLMAQTVYLQAAARFPAPSRTYKPSPILFDPSADLAADAESEDTALISYPDSFFFNTALRALALPLGFLDSAPYLLPADRDLLQRIVGDMRAYKCVVPESVLRRVRARNGQVLGQLAPRDYRVGQPWDERKEREERGRTLRGLAEELVRADEEGLWRDKDMGKEDEWGVGSRWREEGEIVGLEVRPVEGRA